MNLSSQLFSTHITKVTTSTKRACALAHHCLENGNDMQNGTHRLFLVLPFICSCHFFGLCSVDLFAIDRTL